MHCERARGTGSGRADCGCYLTTGPGPGHAHFLSPDAGRHQVERAPDRLPSTHAFSPRAGLAGAARHSSGPDATLLWRRAVLDRASYLHPQFRRVLMPVNSDRMLNGSLQEFGLAVSADCNRAVHIAGELPAIDEFRGIVTSHWP